MQVHAATFRAIFAVLRRKEHTTDREAWEAHGAAARTYQKWKSLIEPLETETTVNNFFGGVPCVRPILLLARLALTIPSTTPHLVMLFMLFMLFMQ